jgi:aspartyl-tRNA(Asn)/glutamyl-tRNA(Gln) amidotransferase subunit A
MTAAGVTSLTIDDFGRRLRAREWTSAQIVEACLARIAADQNRLNAFISVMADEARRDAAAADRELSAGRDRGPLHGVPISVKDLFDVKGMPTTAASRVREGHVAANDAPAIARLREAGAIVVGKTNLHEFAFGTTNEDSAFGPARHPVDPSRSPGGSSGGSAVSVAAGMALTTLGTDTGGSIRIPAAACGLVGLKPTFGELPTGGVVPLSGTLDHVGPLARTVADAAHVYRALGGHRPDRLPSPPPAHALRLAVPRRYFCDVLDDAVQAAFDQSIAALRAAGVTVGEMEIAGAADIPAIYLHIVLADAAAYHAATLESMPDRYTKPVRLRLEMGRYVLAEDYVRALAGRERLRTEVDVALRTCDALVLPTLPIVAPPIGASTVKVGTADEPVRNLMLRLTQLFNLTGHPAISLPCGTSPAGLPCGLQLVGRRGDTWSLIGAARTVEGLLAAVPT